MGILNNKYSLILSNNDDVTFDSFKIQSNYLNLKTNSREFLSGESQYIFDSEISKEEKKVIIKQIHKLMSLFIKDKNK